jgi:hypothetical protein
VRAARIFLHFASFALAFSIEVRVEASERVDLGSAKTRLPVARKVVQEPAGCLTANGSSVTQGCAIGTASNERFTLLLESSSIALDRSTSVIRENSTLIRLLNGAIWVRSKGDLTVQTEFGEAKIESEGEMWVRRSKDQMIVSATDVPVLLIPRGGKEALVIEMGLENEVGRVGKKGQAETGLPTPIDFRDHVERWARLYDGDKKSFEEKVRQFHSLWQEAGHRASEIHRQLHARKLASMAEDKKKREKARSAEESRNRDLREMLRRRVFEE